MRDSVLQLQTDLFCWEFLKGVKNWLEDIKKDMNKKRKLEGMLKIEPLGKNSNLF